MLTVSKTNGNERIKKDYELKLVHQPVINHPKPDKNAKRHCRLLPTYRSSTGRRRLLEF